MSRARTATALPSISISNSRTTGSGTRRFTGKIAYHNRMPKEIVAIFEKHGFIWAGESYHYDTMQLEYRPELLAAGE